MTASGIPAIPAPPLRATVFVGSWPTVPVVPGEVPEGTFGPANATLISGPSEAVLIDACHLKAEVQALGDMIESTGKKLTTIYVTHDHADHYLGIGPLLERFPGSRAVTLPSIRESMDRTWEGQRAQWAMFFGDKCIDHGPKPDVLEGDSFLVDGYPVNVIEVPQADIHPTSIVHVPELDLVVAGDAIYNEIHPMLALSSPEEWQDWLRTIQIVEDLDPKMLVAGHRRPDGDDRAVAAMIAQTRSYIHDFGEAFDESDSMEGLISAMVARYPTHGNLWALQVSAAGAFERRAKTS